MGKARLFYEDEAIAYGIDAAVLINYLRLFILGNKSKGINEHGGRTYTYNTYAEIADQHKFWSEDQVGRMVRKLRDEGVLVTKQLSKHGYDRTTWYAFRDEESFLRESGKQSANAQDATRKSASSTICTKEEPKEDAEGSDDLLSFDAVFAYFYDERGYERKFSEDEAHAFIAYWQEDPHDALKEPLTDKTFKRRAATWAKNFDDPPKRDLDVERVRAAGFTIEEIETRPGSGWYDTTRYIEKDGRYYLK